MLEKHFLFLSLVYCLLSYTYQDYKRDFNKAYSTLAEDLLHETAFNASMAYIQQINNQNLDYKLAPTKWSDKLSTEISGTVKVNIDKSNITPKTQLIRVSSNKGSQNLKVASASSLDWRSSGKVTPVKDQEACGCCWAFSTGAVAESLFLINNNTNVSVSTEYLLECTKDSGCEGGYVNLAIRLALQNGLPSASKYPYLAANYSGILPSTAGICTVQSSFYKFPADTTTQNYYNLSNSQMKTLIETAPIVALINANSAFMQYGTGIFKCNYTITQNQLNHAVVIVGYDSSGNYLIKNSWGTSWGSSGFGWVSGANSENCGLNLYTYQMSSKTFVNSGSSSDGSSVTPTIDSGGKWEGKLFVACWVMVVVGVLFC